MNHRLRFVITVDDAGLGQDVEIERRSIRFFEDFGVPASFFVVPETSTGLGLAEDSKWLARARTYETAGFDYQLHSYRHAGFEFGPPEPWMVQICGPDAIRQEAEGYPAMRRHWTDDALRDKLRKAIAAFEGAFERRPQVFRAGCLAAGQDAFRIMGEEGLHYDSDKVVDPKAWDFLDGQFESSRPWDPAVPLHPYDIAPGVVELPCMGEYAWTLSAETLHHFTRLAGEDMAKASQSSGLFILMCHQQRVGGEDDLPREVLSHIFRGAKSDHNADFITLRELVRAIEAGEISVNKRDSP